MDVEGYAEQVHEQVQAYGFKPLEPPIEISSDSVYQATKTRLGLIKQEKYVSITTTTEESVEPVRKAAQELREAGREHNGTSVRLPIHYPLIVSTSVTESMEIFIEEGCNFYDGTSVLYPIIADVSTDTLLYKDITEIDKLMTGHFGLREEAKKLFQL